MTDSLSLQNAQVEVQFSIDNELKINRLNTEMGEIISPSLPAIFVGPHLQKEPSLVPWQAILERGILKAKLVTKGLSMSCSATLKERELLLALTVVSEADSLVGFSFSFPQEELSPLISDVKEKIEFDHLDSPLLTFHPYNLLDAMIRFFKRGVPLSLSYSCSSAENSWLYDRTPEKVLRLTPCSSQDPLHPNLTVSSIDIALKIG